MRVARKVMPPILLCWPTMSEADVGDMAAEVEPSRQYSVAVRQMTVEGQSDKVVRMKQRCVI